MATVDMDKVGKGTLTPHVKYKTIDDIVPKLQNVRDYIADVKERIGWTDEFSCDPISEAIIMSIILKGYEDGTPEEEVANDLRWGYLFCD